MNMKSNNNHHHKSVSFNEYTTIREIHNLSELSENDINDVWYSDDEYADIKKHVTETIKRSTDGHTTFVDDHENDDGDDEVEDEVDDNNNDNGRHHASRRTNGNSNSNTNDDDVWCLRGLEGRTKFGARRRRNNKAKALDAVWTTQVALWKQRIDNPAVIAAAYKPHSTNAKYPAIAMAHKDELYSLKTNRKKATTATATATATTTTTSSFRT